MGPSALTHSPASGVPLLEGPGPVSVLPDEPGKHIRAGAYRNQTPSWHNPFHRADCQGSMNIGSGHICLEAKAASQHRLAPRPSQGATSGHQGPLGCLLLYWGLPRNLRVTRVSDMARVWILKC
jgi:hypothetical protein